jgi:hypothetical protein
VGTVGQVRLEHRRREGRVPVEADKLAVVVRVDLVLPANVLAEVPVEEAAQVALDAAAVVLVSEAAQGTVEPGMPARRHACFQVAHHVGPATASLLPGGQGARFGLVHGRG